MNYRHAYHAGNFGDCLKQTLLFWILQALQRKPTPLTVLETHAGAGAYDLSAEPAARTDEWRDGIGRLREKSGLARKAIASDAPLADYLAAVGHSSRFPGSALLMRGAFRPGDHLICCELNPEEFAPLARCFGHDPGVALHHRDGWEALGALLPPTPRRGLVFIDPPYERPDEFDRLATGIIIAHKRWANGVLAAWYPIKHRTPARELHEKLAASGVPDIVAAELTLRAPVDPRRLNGAGMIVVNPPYGFTTAAEAILAALFRHLSTGEVGGGVALTVIAPEKPRSSGLNGPIRE